jgi:hypothetical protein
VVVVVSVPRPPTVMVAEVVVTELTFLLFVVLPDIHYDLLLVIGALLLIVNLDGFWWSFISRGVSRCVSRVVSFVRGVSSFDGLWRFGVFIS